MKMKSFCCFTFSVVLPSRYITITEDNSKSTLEAQLDLRNTELTTIMYCKYNLIAVGQKGSRLEKEDSTEAHTEQMLALGTI